MESITLQTNDSIVSSGDLLGQLQFAASSESDGGASRLVVAKVYAQGEGAFSASSNPASIVFATSSSDDLAATGRIKVDDNGNLLPLENYQYSIGRSGLAFNNLYANSGYFSSLQVNGVNVSVSGHTHISSQITDFNESVDDRVNSLLVQGTGVQITYNDSGNTLRLDNLHSEINILSQEPQGFVNRLDSLLSFNDSTRTFTIQPSGSSYDIYIEGVKVTKTGVESVVIDTGTALNYIHFDTDTQQLQTKTSAFDFNTDVPVAFIHWNKDINQSTFFGEERHGIRMDSSTHRWIHNTFGMQYIDGLSVSNYTLLGDGSSNSHAQIAISDGTLYQEDIIITIADGDNGVEFTQQLSPTGYFPVYYHSGITGQWVRDSGTPYPVKYNATRALYNVYTTGIWTLQNVTNNRYFAMWLVATNDINDPILAIMGQREDSSLGSAESNNNWSDIDLTNIPTNEIRPLYRLIFNTNDTYANTPKSSLQSILDLRSTNLTVTYGVPQNDHGNLFGLADDDHTQYVHINNSRTISANHTFTNGLTISSGLLSATSGNFTSLTVNSTGVSLSGHTHTAANITDFNSAVSGLVSGIYASGNGIVSHIAYWSSTNGLTSDSGQLYWDATNNRLGVGTVSPTDMIDVSGTLRVRTLNTASGNFVTTNSSGVLQQRTASQVLSDLTAVTGVGTSGYVARWISNSGLNSGILYDDATNVGIGTTTPSGKIDVRGNSYFGSPSTANSLYLRTGQSGISETALRLRTDTSSNLYLDAGNASVKVGNQSADVIISAGNGPVTIGNSATQTVANQYVRFTPANIERMRIDGTGNVGIGNASPSYRLDVTGTGNFTGDLYTSGNIGIGKTTPAYRLDVVGTGNFSQNLLVNGTGVSVSGHTHIGDDILIIADSFGVNNTILSSGSTAAVFLAQLNNNGLVEAIDSTATQIKIYQIEDFNSSVSGLLPVKDILAGTNISVSSSSGIYTINSTASGGSASISGVGVSGYVARWNAPSGLSSGIIYDNLSGVGIGTSSPTYRLDIASTGSNLLRIVDSSTNRFVFEKTSGNYSSLTTADNGGRKFAVASHPNDLATDVAYVAAVAQNVGAGATLSSPFNADSNHISIRARGDIVHFAALGGSVTERLRITSSGNVGIGNSSPAYRLDVTGTGNFTSNLYASGNLGIGTASPTNTIDTTGTLRVRTLNTASGNFVTTNSSGVLQQRTAAQVLSDLTAVTGVGSSGYVSRWISNSGLGTGIIYDNGTNVGIGTISPAYKLHVSGSFAATTKSFSIDHPSKPEMTLNYGSLESPYHGVRLTGRDSLSDGYCVVSLPDYIKDLVHDDDLNVQITNYKHGKILYVDSIDLNNNQFIVRCDSAYSNNLEFFWTFTGTRKDVDRLIVERTE
jgi:hypothetical protein